MRLKKDKRSISRFCIIGKTVSRCPISALILWKWLPVIFPTLHFSTRWKNGDIYLSRRKTTVKLFLLWWCHEAFYEPKCRKFTTRWKNTTHVYLTSSWHPKVSLFLLCVENCTVDTHWCEKLVRFNGSNLKSMSTDSSSS